MTQAPTSIFNLKNTFSKSVPDGSRRLAWDGISFCVPTNWEITSYTDKRRGIRRVEIENEYSMRLEAEWVYNQQAVQLDKIMKNYEEASKELTLHADSRKAIGNLPNHWSATHFVFKETSTDTDKTLKVFSHELATIFYNCPQNSIFCYFILHFLPESSEDPVELTQKLTNSFENHNNANGSIPWQLFDAQFKLPQRFKLLKTTFDIGSKLMIYEWKMRRFFIWHFSCADMFLKNGITPERWVLGLLKAFKSVRGIKYFSNDPGQITWKRKRLHPIGHFDEMIRLCYQYKIGFHINKENNQLVVWLYHYRGKKDCDGLFS